MSFHNLSRDGLVAHTCHEDEGIHQSYPTNTRDCKNVASHLYTQSCGGTFDSFPDIASSFSPACGDFSVTLQTSFDPRATSFSQHLMNISEGPQASNATAMSNIHPKPTGLNLSSFSASMAASPTTLIDTRVSAPTANASRRVKFGCPICGKMCASRPRVGACLNNHMGIEPFVCNGNSCLVHLLAPRPMPPKLF